MLVRPDLEIEPPKSLEFEVFHLIIYLQCISINSSFYLFVFLDHAHLHFVVCTYARTASDICI